MLKVRQQSKEGEMPHKKRLTNCLLAAGAALSLAALAPVACAQNSANSSGTASAGNGGNVNPGTSSGGDAARYTGQYGKTNPSGPIVNGVPANNPDTNTAPTTAGGSTGLGAYGTGGPGSGNGTSPGHQVGYGTAGEAQKAGPQPGANRDAYGNTH
jgi:hypothetical protein